MRTYSRRPPEHQLIEGVLELCRLCLHKINKPVAIFKDDANTYCKFLPMRIMICLGLEITNEECLPNMICSQCFRDLNRYYDFKKRCMLSYQKLKSHYLAVKQREVQKVAVDVKLENDCNLKSNLPEIDGEEGVNELDDEDNEIILSLTDEDALEVISIFNETTASGGHFPEEEQQVQSVTTSYNINDSLDFLNTTTEPPIPPVPDDVTGFLSTILVQLGVLIKNNERITVIDQTFKNVQLETNDGSVTLELIEEDEVEVEEPSVPEIEAEPETEIIKDSSVEFVYNANKGIPTDKAMCGTCGKKFATRGAMVRHEKSHSGARPFECDTCHKTFTQREVLRRHMLIHQPDRPFKCASCERGFTQRAALRSHELAQHAPNRPLALHRCKLCPKVFLHASGLSRHQTWHTDRVYACSSCARPFKDKSSLVRHFKTFRHKAAT